MVDLRSRVTLILSEGGKKKKRRRQHVNLKYISRPFLVSLHHRTFTPTPSHANLLPFIPGSYVLYLDIMYNVY